MDKRKKKIAANKENAELQQQNPIYINGSLHGEAANPPPLYRQRFWSGTLQNGVEILPTFGFMKPSAPRSLILTNPVNHETGSKVNKLSLPPSSAGSEKEGSYQPFKSAGRCSTPLEDPYQSDHYAPQDPPGIRTLLRPPSRTASLCSGGYRKSEGSVVYQPLTPTNHTSAWSNSLMFNKQPAEFFAADFSPPFLPPFSPPMPPPAHTMPQNPMVQTLTLNKDNLYPVNPPPEQQQQQQQQRKSSLSAGKPGRLSYTPINGYISTGAPPEAYQFQKPGADRRNNKVTVVPDGKILGEISSCGSNAGEQISSHNFEEARISIFGKVSALHIPLGLCLIAIGIARLLLYSVWGLGIELVYGIYVVLTGIIGIIGCRHRSYCSLIACCIMSILSCLLCIPPFIIGLLFTIPYSSRKFEKLEKDFFKSDSEPYGVDILLSVMCLLELVVSVVISILGCLMFAKSMSTVAMETKNNENFNMSETSFFKKPVNGNLPNNKH